MKRGSVAVLFYLVFNTIAFAQYSNSWINNGQSYYKIEVYEAGVYRIAPSALAAVGVNVASINPKTIALYHNGIEQKIYVEGQADNSFDSGDFVEFYGEPNDGKLDSALYIVPGSQPHRYRSLFSDTAAYFLTWSSTPSTQRMVSFNGTTLSGTPETHYIEESVLVLSSNYYRGKPISERAYKSNYKAGEGWFGEILSLNSTKDYLVPSQDFYQPGQAPKVEILAFGVSNAAIPLGGPLQNHHFNIKVGANSSNTNPYKDTIFYDYKTLRFNFGLAAQDIGVNNTVFRFQVINDLNVAADNNTVAYIKLVYPRSYNASNGTFKQFNLVSLSGNSRLNFSNYTKTAPLLYDLTTGQRISGVLNASNFEVMVPNAGINKKMVLFDANSDIKQVTALKPVTFQNINTANNYDYIIITHDKLLTGATAFANYRSSAVGGAHNVLIVTSQQLYDQFYYGQHHPLSVSNFVEYIIGSQSQKPSYLLLLGKGFSGQYLRDPEPSKNRFNQDLVPTLGVPGSDNMLTYGVNATLYQPAISIGRISARNNAEIQNYLNKLIEYESAPPAQWHKDILQVSGGNNPSEKQRFGSFLGGFKNHLANPELGALVELYEKDVSSAVTTDPKQLVIDRINSGIIMYQYFGHGSATKVAVDVGNAFEYNNKGKYPLMYFNGCSVGDCFTDESIGEEFIFEPNKGAIGWLAHSNLGFENYLYDLGLIVSKRLSTTQYGQSMGDIVKASLEEFQTGVLFDLDITHIQQFVFQGDPALKLYNSPQPDYQITAASLFVNPNDVTALSDSFYVGVIIDNLGRATNDSVEVSLRRTLPDNSVSIQTIRNKPIYNTDTIYFVFRTADISTRGLNNFTATVDPNFKIAETNELNNSANLEFFMPANSVNLLLPQNYSIVSTQSVELIYQNNNLLAGPQNYILEVDTAYLFNSPWKITRPVSSPYTLVREQVNLLTADSIVYYWRAKIDLPTSQGGVWQHGSFTYFNGSNNGWNQSAFGQIMENQLVELEVDSASESIKFVRTQYNFTAKMSRFQAQTNSQLGIRKDQLLLSGGNCGSSNGVRAVVIDQASLNPWRGKCGPASNPTTWQFDITSASGRIQLKRFVDSIPIGDYLLLTSYNMGAEFLKLDSIPLYMLKVGADTAMINAINNSNMAYAFIGRKGYPSFAEQDTSFSPNQFIDSAAYVSKDISGPWYKGTITSKKIGPASNWQEFSQSIGYSKTNKVNDQVLYSIYGVDAADKDTLLYSNISTINLSLTAISPSLYPFIKVKAYIKDSIDRSIPQLNRWTVLYEGVPEGTILIDDDFVFQSDTIGIGDTVKVKVKFQNISKYSMDSVNINYSLVDNNRNNTLLSTYNEKPLPPGATIPLSYALSTNGLSGTNFLKLQVSPLANAHEIYLFNNVLSNKFLFNRDAFNPLLDVTFEGRRIFDGDIVAPSPNILITMRDENPQIVKADSNNFVVQLGIVSNLGTTYSRKYFGTGELELQPAANDNKAKVLFKPQDLADGNYELYVEAKDISGNASGTQPYRVNFRVINEAMVTNIYPYPNPFSTSMRFVYTLTGSKVPDQMKIQVYTISGKLVKEITKTELEPIYIGNNISSFTWDGTDEYGDRLANGVYFYKVNVSSDGERLKSYDDLDVNGDKFFKNNIGKIYILR